MLILKYPTHKQLYDGVRHNRKKKKPAGFNGDEQGLDWRTPLILCHLGSAQLHFAHVLMAVSKIQFYPVLRPLSGHKVKWLPREKNRTYPLNPLQDSFKAAVISFDPTTKYLYSSLRHVDAACVWRL